MYDSRVFLRLKRRKDVLYNQSNITFDIFTTFICCWVFILEKFYVEMERKS